MKNFKMVIMAIMFVILLTFSVQAADCERYWNELVNQCFATNIDKVEYTICFGGSVCGPCPSGIAVLTYSLIEVIDDTEYVATIEIDCSYCTTSTTVIIEGIEFVLVGNQLIMLPENPLVLNRTMEE